MGVAPLLLEGFVAAVVWLFAGPILLLVSLRDPVASEVLLALVVLVPGGFAVFALLGGATAFASRSQFHSSGRFVVAAGLVVAALFNSGGMYFNVRAVRGLEGPLWDFPWFGVAAFTYLTAGCLALSAWHVRNAGSASET